MFCPNCGKQIPDGASFCGECGSPVSSYPHRPGSAASVFVAPPSPGAPTKKSKAPFIGIAVATVLLIVLLVWRTGMFAPASGPASGTFAPDFEIGGTLTVGAYNGKPLTWRVLDMTDRRALVVAEDCVTVMAYNEWVDTNRDGGNDTKDRIFLLSIDEADKYFSDDADRIAKYDWSDDDITRVARNYEALGLGMKEDMISRLSDYLSDDPYMTWWWLRSLSDIISAAYVGSDGGIAKLLIGEVYLERGAVRPALYVSILKP